MVKKINKAKLISYVATITLALIILMDFSLSGNAFKEEIIHIDKGKQTYNNAGGNYHYFYKVKTAKRTFSVSKEFATTSKDKIIYYTTSSIFNEINSYGSPHRKNLSRYSLRTASGLILPLVVILILLVSLKLKKRIDTLVFVLQAVLIADLIFLLL